MRSIHCIVAPVATDLLAAELPALPAERRSEVVAFVVRRTRGLPDVTRAGVMLVATGVRAVWAAPGGARVVRGLLARDLPLVGEYARLVRSLSIAYVWERWPDTAPDGRPGGTADRPVTSRPVTSRPAHAP